MAKMACLRPGKREQLPEQGFTKAKEEKVRN
jgi:hypothetical protein